MPDLNRLFQKYRDRAAFYIIYIQEAHPVDAWQVPTNVKDNVLVASPVTAEDRRFVADKCVRDLGIEFPALVDGPDNSVERAYTGWPDRLYVIGADGRVAYKSAPGPFGFRPEEVEAVLVRFFPDAPPGESSSRAR